VVLKKKANWPFRFLLLTELVVEESVWATRIIKVSHENASVDEDKDKNVVAIHP
jgi:hypothetical protein